MGGEGVRGEVFPGVEGFMVRLEGRGVSVSGGVGGEGFRL